MTYGVYVTTVNNDVHCVKSHMTIDDAMLKYRGCVGAMQDRRPVFIDDPDGVSCICVNSSHIVEIVLEDEKANADMVQRIMDDIEARE